MSQDNTVSNLSPARRFFRMSFTILRWFAVSVFSALLIIALILHAPLKVIIFLLIFTLCTACLRWKLQFAFWFVVSMLIIALFVWLYLPESNQAWCRYEFRDRIAEFNRKHAIADDKNAALIYDRLLQQYSGFDPSLLDITRHGLNLHQPWSSTDFPELAGILRSNGHIITSLLEAVSYEYCRFPLADSLSKLDVQMRRTAFMKCFARILINSSNNDIGNGKTDQAFEKQLAVVRMAHHNLQQQSFHETLAGNRIEVLGFHCLNHFIIDSSPTEDQLIRLERLIADYPANNLDADWPVVYESLQLLATNLTGLLFETNYDKDIRRSRKIPQIVNSRLNIKYYLNSWEKRLCRLGALLHWFTLPAEPAKCADFIDRSFSKYGSLIEPGRPPAKIAVAKRPPIRLNIKSGSDIAAHYCASFYLPLHAQSLRRLNAHRSTSILIALSRHHTTHESYPASLNKLLPVVSADCLIDPLNDSQFVYRLTSNGFIFYSKGKNNIDDSGTSNPFNETDDILYWPPPYQISQKDLPIAIGS